MLYFSQVDFKCLSAGVYVADMKVISTPVASVSGEMEMSSAFVSLQGFAEEPKLEVNFYKITSFSHEDDLSKNDIIASCIMRLWVRDSVCALHCKCSGIKINSSRLPVLV